MTTGQVPGEVTCADRPSHPEIVVPLLLRGAQAGSLIVAQRSPKEPYSERDLALLEDLARPIAVAAHAATLTRDLQRWGQKRSGVFRKLVTRVWA